MKGTIMTKSFLSRLALAGATALSLSLAMPVEAKVSAKGQELLEEAQEYLAKGDIRAAVIEMKNAVRADPDSPELRVRLGELYLTVGQFHGAEKELRTALKKGIDPAIVQLPLAKAYFGIGSYQDVLDKTSVEHAREEDKLALKTERARTYVALKNYAEGERLSREILAQDPKMELAASILTSVLIEQRRFEEASEQVDTFMATNTESAMMHYWQGEIARATGNVGKALPAYDASLNLQPNLLPALISRALARMAGGDSEGSQQDIDAILTAHPTHLMGKYLQALKMFREQKYGQADDVLVSLGDAIKSYAPAVYLSAGVKFSLNDLDQAEKLITEYLAINADFPPALGVLGGVQLRRGQVLRAIETLERATELDQTNLGALVLLGQAYMIVGRFQEAEVVLENARTIDPSNVNLKTQTAITKLGLGQQEEGLANLEALLSEGENVDKIGFALVMTHLREGKYDKAMKVVDKLEASMPGDPLPGFYRGNVHRLKGEMTEALQAYEKVSQEYPDYLPAKVNAATLLMDEGDLPAARQRMEKLFEDHPDRAELLRYLSRIAELQANELQAIAYLRQAVELDDKQPQHQLDLVQLLLRLNKPKEGLTAAKTLVQAFPDLPQSTQAWAQAAMAQGDTSEAVLAMRQLVRQAPENAIVQYNFGIVLKRHQDLRGAKEAFERALELNPDLRVAHRAMVDLVLELEGLEQALELAQQYGKGDSPESLGLSTADLMARAGKYKEALPLYAEMLERDPNPVVVGRYYNTLMADGRPDEAIKWLQDWVASHGSDTESKMLLALGLLQRGKMDEAAAHYKELTSIVPANPVPWNNLAWIYGQQGRDDALDVAKEAYERASKSALVADTYAWLLFKQGNIADSSEILKRAYVTVTKNPEIVYHYAAVLNAQGKTEEAIKLLEKAIASKDNFAERDEAKALLQQIR